MVQLVLGGDEIIEDVDEKEQPENLDGVSLLMLQIAKKPLLNLKVL